VSPSRMEPANEGVMMMHILRSCSSGVETGAQTGFSQPESAHLHTCTHTETDISSQTLCQRQRNRFTCVPRLLHGTSLHPLTPSSPATANRPHCMLCWKRPEPRSARSCSWLAVATPSGGPEQMLCRESSQLSMSCRKSDASCPGMAWDKQGGRGEGPSGKGMQGVLTLQDMELPCTSGCGWLCLSRRTPRCPQLAITECIGALLMPRAVAIGCSMPFGCSGQAATRHV